MVGPRGEGQAKRGALQGVKFKVLQFDVDNKKYYLFADMYRSPGTDFTNVFKKTVAKERDTLIAVFKQLVDQRKSLKSFKSYFKYFEATFEKATPALSVEEHVKTSSMPVTEPSEFEKQLAQTLVSVFPKVDFTFKDEDRSTSFFALTKDISKELYQDGDKVLDTGALDNLKSPAAAPSEEASA